MENAYSCGRLATFAAIKINENVKDVNIFKAKVFTSMKNKLYKVEVSIVK